MQDRCCSRLFYSVYEQQQATGVLKKPEEGTVDVAVSVGGGVHVLYKTEKERETLPIEICKNLVNYYWRALLFFNF